jgi:hypothetical protein
MEGGVEQRHERARGRQAIGDMALFFIEVRVACRAARRFVATGGVR